MGQDIVAVGIVLATVGWTVWRSIRRWRRGMMGECASCHTSGKGSPGLSYLIPPEALGALGKDAHPSSSEGKRSALR